MLFLTQMAVIIRGYALYNYLVGKNCWEIIQSQCNQNIIYIKLGIDDHYEDLEITVKESL